MDHIGNWWHAEYGYILMQGPLSLSRFIGWVEVCHFADRLDDLLVRVVEW